MKKNMKEQKSKTKKNESKKNVSKNRVLVAFSIEPESAQLLKQYALSLARSQSFIVNELIKNHLKGE